MNDITDKKSICSKQYSDYLCCYDIKKTFLHMLNLAHFISTKTSICLEIGYIGFFQKLEMLWKNYLLRTI